MRKRMINIAPLLALAACVRAVFRNDVNDDLKELIQKHEKAWNDFKAENNKLREEFDKTGKESATTRQNVETLNKRLDEIADSIKAAQEKLETKVNRIGLAGGDPTNADKREKARVAFNAATRKALSAEQFDAYTNAIGEYLRKGEKASHEVMNAMSVGYEQGGGYLVEADKTGPIARKLYETSPMRQIATVIPVSTTNALEGLVDNDEVTSGWVSETGTRSETDTPELGKWRIEIHEQYAEPRITQQLLDDAMFPVESWLADKIADKLGRTENTAFVTGNGSGKPRGFLDYSKVTTGDSTRAWNAIQYIASGKSADFADTDPADAILDMIYALKAGYRAGATFVASRATFGAIRKLKDGDGNYLAGAKLVDGAFIQTIFGFPAVEAEDMPAIEANSYSLAFGNFKAAYIIVDRQGVRVLVDPYTAKPYVKYYTTKRVGGGLVNGEAIKLMKFAAS